MMPKVVIFGSDPLRTARVQSILERSPAVQRANYWWQVEASSATTSCAVIVLESLGGTTEYAQLVGFKASAPTYPVVLVTTKDAENARELKSVIIDEVIWTCEAAQRIENVVKRISSRGILAGMAQELGSANHLPERLRAALIHAYTSVPPVRTVRALAESVGCDRSTLSRQWRKAVGENRSIRLEDILDSVLLLHALQIRACGSKWASIADLLGVHLQTLARIAARRGNSSLNALARGGAEALAVRLHQDLRKLLGLYGITKRS